jgi:hypothetical protein
LICTLTCTRPSPCTHWSTRFLWPSNCNTQQSHLWPSNCNTHLTYGLQTTTYTTISPMAFQLQHTQQSHLYQQGSCGLPTATHNNLTYINNLTYGLPTATHNNLTYGLPTATHNNLTYSLAPLRCHNDTSGCVTMQSLLNRAQSSPEERTQLEKKKRRQRHIQSVASYEMQCIWQNAGPRPIHLTRPAVGVSFRCYG